jgi:hypothetical protein
MIDQSLKDLAAFQRPGTAPTSLRSWLLPHPTVAGSVRRYITAYKGSGSLVRLQDLTTHLLNGGAAGDPQASPFWNAIMTAAKDAFNAANNTSYGIAMDWFHINDPASNVASAADLLAIAGKLIQEGIQTNSVRFAGDFRLDLQTGDPNLDPTHFYIPPPDPRPVFDWALVLAVDPNKRSMTISIDIKYDHMESNHMAEDLLGALVAFFTAGFVGPVLAILLGVELSQTLTQDYNGKTGHAVLDFLGGGWGPGNPFLMGPVELRVSSPNKGEFVLSGTYFFTQAAWQGLLGVLSGIIQSITQT